MRKLLGVLAIFFFMVAGGIYAGMYVLLFVLQMMFKFKVVLLPVTMMYGSLLLGILTGGIYLILKLK